MAAFLQGLQDAGWEVGRNLSIEYRWSVGDRGRLFKDARELVALNPEVILAGVGATTPALQQAIRDCRAADYVRTVDHVPHEQIRRYYSTVDVCVCPRRRIRLTELVTPLKPLEAMALMKPVLASDVGGIRELVEHERTGLLFAAEDSEDFLRQAERLIDSADLRRRLAERGREFVTRERDWKVLARRYSQIYDFVRLPSRRAA